VPLQSLLLAAQDDNIATITAPRAKHKKSFFI